MKVHAAQLESRLIIKHVAAQQLTMCEVQPHHDHIHIDLCVCELVVQWPHIWKCSPIYGPVRCCPVRPLLSGAGPGPSMGLYIAAHGPAWSPPWVPRSLGPAQWAMGPAVPGPGPMGLGRGPCRVPRAWARPNMGLHMAPLRGPAQCMPQSRAPIYGPGPAHAAPIYGLGLIAPPYKWAWKVPECI